MLQLFLPQICIHCEVRCDRSSAKQRPLTKYLCAACLRQFELFDVPKAEDLIMSSSLFRELPQATKLYSAFRFQNGGIIQSVIHHFKYRDMPKLASILGVICHERMLMKENYDLIIPIPLHRTRYSERGYNQSEMLAVGISKISGIKKAKRNWLKRVRQTPSQTGFSVEEREENVRDAFKLSESGKKAFYKKRLLIIDDVITTGATLSSAAKAVLDAAPQKIDLFSMAAVTDMGALQ